MSCLEGESIGVDTIADRRLLEKKASSEVNALSSRVMENQKTENMNKSTA